MRKLLLSTYLNGSAQGQLEFGNCWSAGTVKVYLNGEEIGSANPNTLNKKIVFDYTDGSKLEIKDEGQNSIIQFNHFDVIKVSKHHQVKCNAGA